MTRTIRNRTISSLILPLALAVVPAAGADVLLTIKSHTEGAPTMGRIPAQGGEIKIWVSPDDQRIRRDEENYSMILRLDKSKMYILDHQAKTYNEVDLPVDFKKIMPQGGEQMMAEVERLQKMDISVKPTTETKKIGNWNTKRYDVTVTSPSGMKVDSQLWMSKDVGFDTAAFSKMQTSMTALNPGNAAWAKKMAQIPGFPVLTESHVSTPQGEVKSSQQLQAADKKPAPAGTYDVPSGYTKTDLGATAGRPMPGRPMPGQPAGASRPAPPAPKPATPPPAR
jgi:hypothetical protein